MSIAIPLKKVASKLMSRFGGTVTIRRITPGIYNPNIGSISEAATDITIKGVLEGVNLREVNDLIQSGDKRLLVAAADVGIAPDTSDRVIIAGVTHQVIRVDTIEQDNQAITYELILRA